MKSLVGSELRPTKFSNLFTQWRTAVPRKLRNRTIATASSLLCSLATDIKRHTASGNWRE